MRSQLMKTGSTSSDPSNGIAHRCSFYDIASRQLLTHKMSHDCGMICVFYQHLFAETASQIPC